MSQTNTFRKLLVKIIPPFFHPLILKIFNSKIVYSFLQRGGYSLYQPSWHTIPSGKLKGLQVFVDASSGEWERCMTDGTYDEYFTNYLAKRSLTGKTFFDIGSHIGYSALTFSKLAKAKARVVAFEPNEFNRERLMVHLQKNGKWGEIVDVYPLAVSDSNGSIEFVFTNNVDGWTSSGSFIASAETKLDKSSYERQYGFKRTVVETITLDTFVKKYKTHPDFIKIDIEGAEHLALSGAISTLKKYKPVVLIELHSILAATKSLKILTDLGYEFEILFEDPDGRVFIAAELKKRARHSR